MRSFGIALLALLAPLGAASAATAADGDVLRQFGMLGRTAVDCAAPPSSRNPYVIFSVSREGKVTRTLKMQDAGLDGTFAMRNLRMAGPDLLQYDETGRQSELTISITKIGGKFRSWRSVRTSGPDNGALLVADGKFASSGSPTLAFAFCGS
jgi:hypothetical protein